MKLRAPGVGTASFAILVAAFGVGCYFVWQYVQINGRFFPTYLDTLEIFRGQRELLGTVGDFFGGVLNPIFSLFTIVLLVVTLFQTQKALRQSSDALRQNDELIQQNGDMIRLTKEQVELSIREMRSSREELEQSRVAHQELAETQKKQRFESTFYALLEQLKEEGREFYALRGSSPHPRLMMSKLFEDVCSRIGSKVAKQNITEQTSYQFYAFLVGQEPVVGVYFSILKTLMRIADSQSNETRLYGEVLSASVPNDIKLLLLVLFNRKGDFYLVEQMRKYSAHLAFFEATSLVVRQGGAEGNKQVNAEIKNAVESMDKRAFGDCKIRDMYLDNVASFLPD